MPTSSDPFSPPAARRPYALYAAAFAAATVSAILVATQNYFRLAEAGQPIPWPALVASELPVWYVWLASTPAVFWLARRFPVTAGKPWARNLLLHLLLSAAVDLANLAVVTAIKWPQIQASPRRDWSVPFIVFHEFRRTFAFFIPIYFIMLAAAHAVYAVRENQRKTLREARLQMLLERARRDVLRMQLQPHFLFNTLHAVSALMERDVAGARRMLARLSDLLRMALDDDSRHEISLEEELAFLDLYAEIQRIRFGGRLSVTYHVAPETRTLLVPRLILQPLVENAITHGLASLERDGHVTVEATSHDGRLRLRVADDGVGLNGGVRREGVGLGNTRARLEQLYGGEASLAIAGRAGGGCEVTIELPAGTLERAAPGEEEEERWMALEGGR